MQRKQGKTRVFQERTNIPTVSLVPHPKPVDFQPLENQTVNPIVVEMQRVADKQSSHKEDPAIRRCDRYTLAEQALTGSFQRSLEHESPPSRLQVVVLRNATSLLQIYISEAADSLEKLRDMLVDRSLEPQEYQHIQRQRWLEEKRLLAAEELSEALRRSLTSPSTTAQPPTIPSVSSNAKSNANLLRFLDYPWSRVSTNRQNYCRHLRNDKAISRNGFPRTHLHHSLLPLTLPSHCRRPLRTAPLTLPPIRIPVPSSFETSETTSVSSPSSTPSSLSDSPSTREATPLPELMSLPPTALLSLPPSSSDTTGTATIWQQTPSFSREEILKDLVVSIPDYVNDLMAEFDSAIPADPPFPLGKLDIVMSNKMDSNDRLPSQSEKTSLSSGTDYSSIPRQQATPPPPKRRHSVLFDTVASHLTASPGDGPMSSLAARRRSSPPSAFPSTFPRGASSTSNEPPRRSTTRRSSISISDLRSVFSGSASSNGPIATSTPINSESAHQPERQQRTSTDEKLLTRLRRRMSFLRRF